MVSFMECLYTSIQLGEPLHGICSAIRSIEGDSGFGLACALERATPSVGAPPRDRFKHGRRKCVKESPRPWRQVWHVFRTGMSVTASLRNLPTDSSQPSIHNQVYSWGEHRAYAVAYFCLPECCRPCARLSWKSAGTYLTQSRASL